MFRILPNNPLGALSPSSSTAHLGPRSKMIRGSQPPHPTVQSASNHREQLETDSVGEDIDVDELNLLITDVDNGNVPTDLTDDLLHLVLSFLDDTSLCQAAMVCRQWRVASSHEDFWKVLNFEDRRVSHQQVRLLFVRYPKATTLILKGSPCVHVDEVQARDAITSLRSLEVLKLSWGFFSPEFFDAIPAECPSLRHLSISDANLGNCSYQEIHLRHESMRSLQIYDCNIFRIAIRCPQLDRLSLKRTSTLYAMLDCPRLIHLDVSSCYQLSDISVSDAVRACPLLESLDISNYVRVSSVTLSQISAICTNLRTLDASHCNTSLDSIRMPMLIELKFHGYKGLICRSMTALSTYDMLEDLHLDFSTSLAAISLDLPRLRQISLSSNRKLTLESPAHAKLNLDNCPTLNRVDIKSNSLLKLVLSQQNGLSRMALQCPRLQEVDLSECENLTDAVCDVFNDGGGCPKLELLVLDSCKGLNHVKLASSSLRYLSLVGCRNITSLQLACSSAITPCRL